MASKLDYEDDDEESLHENQQETSVDIGIINEECENTSESRRILHSSTFYPCKLGGKPQWLDYNNLKQLYEGLVCKSCTLRLSFLLQIYAPLDQSENDDPAFHRYLYLFLCSNANCSAKTFKVYRSQLKRVNDFYSHEAPPVANTLDLADSVDDSIEEKINKYLFDYTLSMFNKNLNKLCNVCGYSSTKLCSKCKFIYYCCESHQKLDWTRYKHKSICEKYCSAQSIEEKVKIYIENELSKDESSTNNDDNTIFPEHEILIEPEVIDDGSDADDAIDEKTLNEQLKLNEHLSKDLENMPENEQDKDFQLFQKRISNEPRQIIRYDRNGKPLWSTQKLKLNEDGSIPNCVNCNSKRIFEFQVMPQLLTYLKLNEDLKSSNTIDWASLYIFTCEKNCCPSATTTTSSYLEEFIYKQDF